MPDTSLLVSYLLPALPFAMLWLMGGVYALCMYGKHPPVARLVLLACGLLLFTTVVGTLANYWLIQQRMNAGWSTTQQVQLMTIVGWGRTGLSLVGYTLLLIAAFGWRAVGPRWPADRDLPPEREPRSPRDPEGIRKPGPPL